MTTATPPRECRRVFLGRGSLLGGLCGLGLLLAEFQVLPAQGLLAELEGPLHHWQPATRRGFVHKGYGRVAFAADFDAQQTRELFEQGMAQLCAFDNREAERSFRQALAEEPSAAMAALGVALANRRHPDRAAHWAGRALLLVEHAQPANRHLIRGLAQRYETDPARAAEERRKRLERDNPEYDPYHPPKRRFEASSARRRAVWVELLRRRAQGDAPRAGDRLLLARELALDLLAAPRPADRDNSQLTELAALLAPVFVAQPRHPAQTWLLLLGIGAPRALAQQVSLAAPYAQRQVGLWWASGLHLGQVGRHQDADVHLEAGMRAAHGYLQREQAMPFALPQYAALVTARVENLCRLGRAREALALAHDLAKGPRHPVYNRLDTADSQARRGLRLLLRVCRRYRLRGELAAIRKTGLFRDVYQVQDLGPALLDLAGTCLLLGNTEAAGEALVRATALQTGLDPRRAGHRALRADMQAAWPLLRLLCEHAQACGQQLPLVFRVASPRSAEALDQALAGLDAEPLLRIDCLRQRGADAGALIAARRGLAAGDVALLLRHLAGEPEDLACAQLLRKAAGRGDLDLALGAPLRALAAAQGWPEDWRQPRDPLLAWPHDLGPRPILESLGPRRWTRSRPRTWILADSEGQDLDLRRYRGKPALVIMYLGFGCLHCIEQLQSFHPRTAEYRKEGIEILAVGLDSVPGTRASLEVLAPGDRFGFPLLSDRKLRSFRTWLAFDDFEHMTLHGTYLLDAEGRLLWQDIDDQPFEHPAWLLHESRRLLAQPRPKTQ